MATEKGKPVPTPPPKPNIEKVLKTVREEKRTKPGDFPKRG